MVSPQANRKPSICHKTGGLATCCKFQLLIKIVHFRFPPLIGHCGSMPTLTKLPRRCQRLGRVGEDLTMVKGIFQRWKDYFQAASSWWYTFYWLESVGEMYLLQKYIKLEVRNLVCWTIYNESLKGCFLKRRQRDTNKCTSVFKLNKFSLSLIIYLLTFLIQWRDKDNFFRNTNLLRRRHKRYLISNKQLANSNW